VVFITAGFFWGVEFGFPPALYTTSKNYYCQITMDLRTAQQRYLYLSKAVDELEEKIENHTSDMNDLINEYGEEVIPPEVSYETHDKELSKLYKFIGTCHERVEYHQKKLDTLFSILHPPDASLRRSGSCGKVHNAGTSKTQDQGPRRYDLRSAAKD